MDMFSTAANEKGISLVFECDGKVPEVIITDE
jgi:hypothetical protein